MRVINNFDERLLLSTFKLEHRRRSNLESESLVLLHLLK
jgi:hypothetical protein